jgi:hypothetical protein
LQSATLFHRYPGPDTRHVFSVLFTPFLHILKEPFKQNLPRRAIPIVYVERRLVENEYPLALKSEVIRYRASVNLDNRESEFTFWIILVH